MAASEVQAAPAPAPSVPTGKWPARPVGLEFQMMGSPNGLTSLAAYYHDLRLTRGYTQFADGNWIVASPKGDPIARVGETTPLMVTYDQDGDLQGAVVSASGDVIAYLTFGGDGGVGFAMNVTIAGADGDAVRGFMARLRLRMTAPNDPPDEQVRVAFAFESADNQFLRHLDAPKWDDIRGNYPEKVRDTLDTYMDEAWRPSAGGKILLLQGSPGTGKTYSLRALLQQWRTWCDAAYITDPEVFFNKSPYLMGILLGGEDDRHQYVPVGAPIPEPRWKLVILEDAGELMARDAKMRTGQALSRLLNVTDGLIGQGLRVILLITTNEELGDLHDAVSRPGRAAAVVRFDRFSPDEARAWLAEHGMTDAPAISEPKTLAELYAILDGRRPTNIEKRAVGFASR